MSTLPRVPLLAVALCASAWLAACTPAAAPAPAAPAAPAAAAPASRAEPATQVSRTARLQAFLSARYGKAATLSGAWRGNWTQDDETRPVDWQVCAEQPVVTGDHWQQLLAVCGTMADGAHIDPGTIDFFVLRPSGGSFEVTSVLTGGRFGSGGVPGTASIIRAGSDFYGFRVEHGWFGQGFSLISQSLVLPGPKGLVASGELRSHIDNAAAYDCDDADAEPDCGNKRFDIDFALRFDDKDRSARNWPLLIEEDGHCGSARVRRTHRFTLDRTTWTYAIPDTLQREGCL